MKARLTAKSELRLSDLTREYTFDILNDSGEIILASQVITSRPDDAVQSIRSVVEEYSTIYYSESDIEVGEEI